MVILYKLSSPILGSRRSASLHSLKTHRVQFTNLHFHTRLVHRLGSHTGIGVLTENVLSEVMNYALLFGNHASFLLLSDLAVTVSPEKVSDGNQVTLTCITTCSLSNNPTYIWYRNSQPLTNPHPTSSNTLSITSVSKEDAGYYSCAVRGHEGHPSPSVCK